MRRLTIELPDDLHHWFKVYSTKKGKSMKKLVIEWLKELKEEEESE